MRFRRAIVPVLLLFAPGALSTAHAQSWPRHTIGSAADVDRLLARMETDERRLAAELEESRPTLELIRRRVIARGRAYYRLTRAGLLPAGGGFDVLVDHAAHLERMYRALARDVSAEGALVKRIGEIETLLSRLHAEREPLEAQHEAMQRARVALQEADERRSAFARAFETSVRPDAIAVYGTEFGPSPDPRDGFHAMRGHLPFPIAGRAEVNRVNHGGGPAVALLAPSGTVVRSVAAGRVSFSDRYDDYGLTVILDHGDHYFSVYANLGGTDVHVGDSVNGGARIGTVASDQGAPARLYFELRHKGSTLDPAPWLGL